MRNVNVNWSPTGQVIATYREPTSSEGEEVFFVRGVEEHIRFINEINELQEFFYSDFKKSVVARLES